jgi:hypothetical protein
LLRPREIDRGGATSGNTEPVKRACVGIGRIDSRLVEKNKPKRDDSRDNRGTEDRSDLLDERRPS